MEKKEALVRLKKLIGKELHELAEKYAVTIYRNGKVNKGWAGHVIERYLGLPLNTAQSPNFGSWELKSIPLKYLKNGTLVFKETMAITMIDPLNVCDKEFADSHLLAKLRKAIIVSRIVGSNVDEPVLVHSVTEINLSGKIYAAVKADYDLVRDTLFNTDKEGIQKNFQKLTGKMGVYIQPRTKGAGHGSKTRAFYARKGFLAEFIDLE